MTTTLLHDLPLHSAERSPAARALTCGDRSMTYAELASDLRSLAGGLVERGLGRGERVAIYLEKRFEFVIAAFGAPAAGAVFVPVNPLLKPDQVAYILRDCNVRVLVTSAERFPLLKEHLLQCHDLRRVVLTGNGAADGDGLPFAVDRWQEVLAGAGAAPHRVVDTDMAAILYTSGSTGRPKGVVLSHRNMVAGAKSVASYLDNRPDDTLLAALPLSFDAGFSQLTTAFHAGARVVLLNYLLPKDVLNALAGERVTGLTAVPPLYIQLTQLKWPESIADHLRYFANTGGRMPLETLKALRTALPRSRPYLMYGLTEAFRSTYLPPEQVDVRPDSIGKAIPNAEILVLREDGSECAANEPGELVHRGALVGMGYWNDPEKTAERYRPLPCREAGLVLPEIAVFSGDTVRRDEEGYLYFIGRRDEMIKTSGYRVSPTEIEEVLYGTQLVGEAAAFGVPHPQLGQAVVVVVTARDGILDTDTLLRRAREQLPAYMVPARIEVRPGPLPRNPNGKIDRKLLASEFQDMYAGSAP
ncbi:MAG TPA: acyl-CoA ligase (AMP-forming), exosortase A system-associated [Rhodocyclaceae bacterium]|nr:acyl-CoA ligase (AMP-forming), exosortase A system-associated [Rhodocyclaceae bacterium]